jgi:hypothetical protein
MEVKIERPFHLKLDIIATDEHVPSMKADVSVHVQQFGHSLEYNGSLWFECVCWDAFVSDLSRIDKTQAKLTDMGGSFVLALGTCSGKPDVSWEMKKIAMDGSVATAACRFAADPDTLAHVTRQFTEFPRWW